MELIAGVLNQSVAVYEMAPAETHIERQTVRWLCDLLGWPDSADGVFTSGGSLGNLTALLAARNHATEGVAWQHGVRACPELAIMVSKEAHYSVARAAGILGIGEDGVLSVQVNERFQMEPAALAACHRQAIKQGKKVFAVVASAGTTATGSYDPLREIGEYCREHKVWFHVDGAHGASVLLSPKYRDLADGIALADSLVWDAHKLLFVPSLATAVLFRERKHNFQAFSQQASYLFGRHPGMADFDLALRTVECTKRMLAFKLWLVLKLYGATGLGELVTRTMDLARAFAALLKSEPDFELLTEPMSNIVCFRHLPNGMRTTGSPSELERLNAHQQNLRQRVIASGELFLVQTQINGAVYLRTTLMNPNLTEKDLARLLKLLRDCSITDAVLGTSP